ncbi:hypothetical protein ACHQM5_002560 [Ranunculus cassubicifolius]
MESSKVSAYLLLCMLFISSGSPILACGYCSKPPPTKKPPTTKRPPITLPPIVKQPPVTLPPVVKQPPVTLPPVLIPPPPPQEKSCPLDSLKLGACVDLLGGLVHVGLGDPVVNECCPVIQGLLEIEAAVCLCTTIRLKLLNINIYLPLALQLLLTCGKTPPPGYTCTI